MKYLLLALAPLLMLWGCADSSTTGTMRQYDIQVNIHDNFGPVKLEFPLNVDATSANDQTTENASDVSPDIKLQLTEGGASGAMSGADAILKDVTSTLKTQLKDKAVERVKEALPTKDEVISGVQEEAGAYHGRHNGDRPMWYFSKDFNEYPLELVLSVAGCIEGRRIAHNGVRYDVDGVILKQSDVSGRGMALVLPSVCKGTEAHISY